MLELRVRMGAKDRRGTRCIQLCDTRVLPSDPGIAGMSSRALAQLEEQDGG